MKNEAERRGADEAPISSTLGMESGNGVVSMRTCWLKLFEVRGMGDRSGEEGGRTLVPWLSGRHGGGGEVLVEQWEIWSAAVESSNGSRQPCS